MYEALAGVQHRKTKAAFKPNTMIDTLLNYGEWLDNGASIIEGSFPKDKVVLIVGAGASGLIAAYELLKAGVKVSIFEATDRVGGRMCSVQYNKESPIDHAVFELGCMRFPRSSATLFHYFKKFGIETKPNFPDPGVFGVNAELYYQNKLIEWPSPKEEGKRSQPDSKLFKQIGIDFNNMLIYLVGDPDNLNSSSKNEGKLYSYWNGYQNGPLETRESYKKKTIDCWQKLIDQYKDVSFEQGIFTLGQNTNIVMNKWTQNEMDAFGALGVGSGGFSPLFNINFLEILRLMVNGFEADQELVPAGISSFTDALVREIKDLGGKIYLNSPIALENSVGQEKMTKNSDKKNTLIFSVNDKSADMLKSQKDDYWEEGCIIATTSRAMQVMGLTTYTEPSLKKDILSKEVKTSLRNLHMTSSSKFFIQVKNKFWLTDGKPNHFPSNIQSDEIFRGLYCLDYDPGKSGGGVVLISYVWEDDSNKLLGLSKQERYDKFLETLRVVNNDFANALDKNKVAFSEGGIHEKYDLNTTNIVDWQSQPYYYGAFKLDYPGTEQQCHDVVYQFQDINKESPIVICGDSISWVGGWMEGALTSGLNAACAIAKSLGANVRAGSPLDEVKPTMYDYSKVNETKIY